MRVITVRNVNEGYRRGLVLLYSGGVKQHSRAGDVIVYPCPVTTVYKQPYERVLFEPTRDANPFFHLMESLWMLAGRNDATWLDQFVSNFSSRFAEDGGIQHGAYGFRWRTHFMLDGCVEDYSHGFELDQLERIIRLLKNNPDDRRIVLQMWDPSIDLGAQVRDVPCNISVLPRIVNNKLDITVTCRSNDIIWGCYGANAVHFSVLQEYLAARIGVGIGTYYQISNNYHAYEDIFHKKFFEVWGQPVFDPYKKVPRQTYVRSRPIVTCPDMFDEDLALFFKHPDMPPIVGYANEFFTNVAVPMFYSYKFWRAKNRNLALDYLSKMPRDLDWYVACEQWYKRRMNKEPLAVTTEGKP